jgi:hypothetical protein
MRSASAQQGASSDFGTVFVAAQHTCGAYGDDAGVFLIHSGDPAPAWQPVGDLTNPLTFAIIAISAIAES